MLRRSFFGGVAASVAAAVIGLFHSGRTRRPRPHGRQEFQLGCMCNAARRNPCRRSIRGIAFPERLPGERPTATEWNALVDAMIEVKAKVDGIDSETLAVLGKPPIGCP